MSMKSGRKSVKSNCVSREKTSKTFVNICIQILELKNLEVLESESEESEICLKIVAKFMNSVLKCKVEGNEESDEFSLCDEEVKLSYDLRSDVSDDETIFDLFSNPLQLSLMIVEPQSTFGQTNVDLYPLCSDLVVNYEQEHFFEQQTRFGFENHKRISIKVRLSSDQPILKIPLANSLYITVESINDLETEASDLSIGLKTPSGSQFSRNVVLSTDATTSLSPNLSKRWFSLYNVPGKGAESQFKTEPYNYLMTQDEQDLIDSSTTKLTLNAIQRTILATESNTFLRKHINESMKLSVEVISGENHLVGFINAEELLHVERKRLRCVVPLQTYSAETLTTNCNYSSVLYKPKPILKSRKSRKDIDRKSFFDTVCEKVPDPDLVEETGSKVSDVAIKTFVVIEFELENPLNPEIYENSTRPLVFEDDDKLEETDDVDDSWNTKIKSLRKKLQQVTKNIFNIYGKEVTLADTVNKMLNDGFFTCIEDYLLSDFCALGCERFSVHEDFKEFRDNFLCEVASSVLNSNEPKTFNKLPKLQLAKVHDFLGKPEVAEYIYLDLASIDNSEGSWIDCGIFYVRKEYLRTAVACTMEAGKENSISLLGNFLKCYVEFKMREYCKCWKLFRSMRLDHGDSLELAVFRQIVAIQEEKQDCLILHFDEESFKKQPIFEEIYNSHELYWFATDKKLLNFNNPWIRCAIFFIKLGCLDLAEILVDDYFENYGSNINNLYLLAVIYVEREKYVQALFYLDLICKEDIGNHQVHYEKIVLFRTILLLKLGEWKSENSQQLELFAERSNIEYYLVNLLVGTFYNDLGKAKKALPFLTQAQKIFPSKLALMQLGKCYRRLKKFRFAEECFQATINYDLTHSFDSWNELYNTYTKENRTELVDFCIENFNCF